MTHGNDTHPIVGGALPQVLSDWWQQAGHSGPPRIDVVEHWQRPYSELFVLDLRGTEPSQRQKLVCKRVLHQSCNDIYGDPTQLLHTEFEMLRSARQALQPYPRYTVPEPHLLLTELETLVMEFAPGNSLEPSLSALRYVGRRPDRRRLERQFWQLGRWLHYYQNEKSVRWYAPEALESVIHHCEHRLKIVEQTQHAELPRRFRSHVLQRIEGWQRSLVSPVPFGPCHGDFGPWNALAAGQQLTVVDFCSSREDSLVIDPLGVLVYLESQRHSPSFSARRIRRLQEVFLRGYACTADLPRPCVAICEALQRICRLQDCLLGPVRGLADRYRLRRVFRENLHELMQGECLRYARLRRVRPARRSENEIEA